MKKQRSGLSKREKLFCICYANTLDAEQSAKISGYKKGHIRKALWLLSRSDVADEIARILKDRTRMLPLVARVGFEKLAFGGIADAVSLLYMDSPTKEKLENMDLFMVSEIKKLKDGAMEIKLFDRHKALTELCKTAQYEKDTASSLIDALNKGAQNLSDMTEDNSEF